MKTAFDKGAKYVVDNDAVWMSDSGFYVRMHINKNKTVFYVEIHSCYPAKPDNGGMLVENMFHNDGRFYCLPISVDGEFTTVKEVRRIASALNLAATIAADVATYRLIYQSERDRLPEGVR